MEIHDSARRHLVPDDDIHHAVRNRVTSHLLDEEEGRYLVLGPDQAGNLLELVVLKFDQGNQLAIHAMKMRPIYADLLPGGQR